MAATAPDSSDVAAAGPVRIVVTPETSASDAALTIQVAGLHPGQHATVKVTSRDAKGVDWASRATFVADGDGVIDPSRLAPRAGSYTGVEPMGLIDSMSSPPSPTSGFVYFWNRTPSEFRFTASVDGRVVASTNVQRYVIPTEPKLVEHGLHDGERRLRRPLQRPVTEHGAAPAVLLFGGSEGGMAAPLAVSLAARVPDLEHRVLRRAGPAGDVVEHPVGVLRRGVALARRPAGSRSSPSVGEGIWGGSEAALLLGANYPDLVYGVAALAPSNAVNCSNPCTSASWTLDGQAVPHTNLGQPSPSDTPGAVIPLERIRGPVLTLCGGADAIAYSCDYADAIAARLQGGGQIQPHRFLTYPDAGHGVGTLLPYQPGAASDAEHGGHDAAANWNAREQAWPQVLDFLGDPK